MSSNRCARAFVSSPLYMLPNPSVSLARHGESTFMGCATTRCQLEGFCGLPCGGDTNLEFAPQTGPDLHTFDACLCQLLRRDGKDSTYMHMHMYMLFLQRY